MISPVIRSLNVLPSAELLQLITTNAAQVDRSGSTLDREIEWLREADWLRKCLPVERGGAGWGSCPDTTLEALEALRLLGAANLSVARLFEGHMNAAKLVKLHGSPKLASIVFEAVATGTLLGVWGADEPGDGVVLVNDDGKLRLSGKKRFASGLELVKLAVISAKYQEGVQLAVVDVQDARRMNAASWNVSGMRATASGTYDFSDIEIARDRLLGAVDAYFIEPHFEGGIWRYCAAQLGAAEILYTAFRDALVVLDRADDAHQQRRIVDAGIAVETARLWIVRAAKKVEAEDANAQVATLSLLARDVTETSCRTVIAAVEASLGMAAHAQGLKIERIRRDLAFYLCQAAPDAKRARAAKTLVERAILPGQL